MDGRIIEATQFSKKEKIKKEKLGRLSSYFSLDIASTDFIEIMTAAGAAKATI